MTYLRHATRHIQETVTADVIAAMAVLGWTGQVNMIPFGTTPVQITRRRMDESEMKSVTGNLLAMSWGGEPDDTPEELGGGLQHFELTLFADVVGENDPISLALASDVKDYLSGRAPGSSRFHQVRDFSSSETGTPVEGWTIEIDDVVRERPVAEWRRSWQVVKATCHVYWVGANG